MISNDTIMRLSLPLYQLRELEKVLITDCWAIYSHHKEVAVRGGLFIDSPEVHTWYHFFSCPMTLDAIFEMATVRNALQLP